MQIYVSELMRERETAKVEFKSTKGGFPNIFRETYSAFANTHGGTIQAVWQKESVFICCHVDSQEAFKVDDYRTAKFIIALSWLPDGLNEWKARWNAQNVLDDTEVIEEAPKNNLLLTALKDMDVQMLGTKCLSHKNDEESCKTYIRAIHKYLPEVQPQEVKNYLVTEFGWENKNASKVGTLLQCLKEGGTFRGGQTTYLKEYYNRWKGK